MKRFLAATAVVVVVGVSYRAHATLVVQPSLEQMTGRSDVIVRAVVEDQSVTYGEGGARILTLSRLRVLEALKGAVKAQDTLTLYQVGGAKDGVVMHAVGINEFALGEEVVLFASAFVAHDTVRFLQAQRKVEVPEATLNPSAGYVVTYGAGLGKYVVQRSASGGATAVEQLGDVVSAQGPLVANRQPLPVLVDEVRRLAATHGRKP